jgi:membrane protein implicated in regulation of membrane protease activity
MDLWIVWVVLAVAFGFGELHTNGFFLAPFAAGAGIAAVVALAGAGAAVGVVVFLVASLATLGLLRPIAVGHRKMPPTIRTGAAALVGQRGTVVERIENRQGLGFVRIGGEVWTARSYDEDLVIEAGSQVEVVEIKGATALVME